ncbi:hypothetical protein Nepgr_024435 [Nepenthes gracilis]|uniref:Uncharacterized protein n=1 Tax=Nepenthes gracilis TaxID=150966 RepID=A0AAD3T5Y5_NEPGR|nr:hypothetical protein Nepgr_024435 [Nepenthes gracilis]
MEFRESQSVRGARYETQATVSKDMGQAFLQNVSEDSKKFLLNLLENRNEDTVLNIFEDIEQSSVQNLSEDRNKDLVQNLSWDLCRTDRHCIILLLERKSYLKELSECLPHCS